MISNLLKQFNELTKKLQKAIIDDDWQAVTKLDHQISQVWKQTLSFEPTNQDDAYHTVEFLLDRITESQEMGEYQKHAKGRVLKIIRGEF